MKTAFEWTQTIVTAVVIGLVTGSVLGLVLQAVVKLLTEVSGV